MTKSQDVKNIFHLRR